MTLSKKFLFKRLELKLPRKWAVLLNQNGCYYCIHVNTLRRCQRFVDRRDGILDLVIVRKKTWDRSVSDDWYFSV